MNTVAESSEKRDIPTLKETIEFLKVAHDGQKYGDHREYYHHPIEVCMRLLEVGKSLNIEIPHFVQLAALLHDVLEDTKYTREDLEKLGYPKNTLDIVEALTNTRLDDKSIENYFQTADSTQGKNRSEVEKSGSLENGIRTSGNATNSAADTPNNVRKIVPKKHILTDNRNTKDAKDRFKLMLYFTKPMSLIQQGQGYWAALVKLCDIEVNSADINLKDMSGEERKWRDSKYIEPKNFLKEELKKVGLSR